MSWVGHTWVLWVFSLMMRHGMVQMHNWANMLLRFSFSKEGESDVQYSPASKSKQCHSGMASIPVSASRHDNRKHQKSKTSPSSLSMIPVP